MRFGGMISSEDNLHKIALMVIQGDLSPIKRLPDIKLKYDRFVVRTEKKYGSIENFITDKFLNKEQGYCLVANKFPYNTNSAHLILWTDFYLTNEEIEIILKKELRGNRYFWFEQTYQEKSIKTINHIHVFVDITKK